MFIKFVNKTWFTLIEIVIAVSILAWILVITNISFYQFTENKRLMLLQNEIISEANYLFENVIKYVRNWNIDHQSYWRENIRNRSANDWWNEWSNAVWVDSYNNTPWNYNSIRNCSWAQTNEINIDTSEWDLWWKNILENYLYQFIFPWIQQISSNPVWTYLYNAMTDWKVHLNCSNDLIADNINTSATNERNIYDDDKAYWRWPRAFSWSDWSKWKWSWNEDSSSTSIENNPPLMILSSNWKIRTAIRYATWSLCNNSSWCILIFENRVASYNDSWIADAWECLEDYNCPWWTLTWIVNSQIWWKDITPSNAIVTDFNFYIWPEKDQSLAFNENAYVKPSYVILTLWVQASKKAMTWLKNKRNVSLSLQTTIIPRNLYSVETLN